MKKVFSVLLLCISLLILEGCSYTAYGLYSRKPKDEYVPALAELDQFPADEYSGDPPKSIIYIIADGAGIGHHTLGYYAIEQFAPARFEHIGLVTTHPVQPGVKVTDSAASGTALATGQKTYNGAISVDLAQLPIKTSMELAKEKGMATGLVATSTISHATPAVFMTHVAYRKDEPAIARQLALAPVDVLLGGGSSLWTEELQSQIAGQGGQYCTSMEEIDSSSGRVVGLFNEGAMNTYNEGRVPGTLEMTEKALELLDSDPDGFFLMVEESQIDWAGHANSATYLLGEMNSMNELVNFCLDYQAAHPDVLLILTADHETGGVTIEDGEEGQLKVSFASVHHSANMVPVFASGPGAEAFDSMMDNTELAGKIIEYIRR